MADTFGRTTQSAIYLAGVAGTKPAVPVSASALEEAARRKLSAKAWAYVAGSAGSEHTAASNLEAFRRWKIVPRMLAGTAERDLSIELFGIRHPTPFLAAPVGVLDLAHPSADLGIARAAADLGIPYVLSNQASVPMEDVADEMNAADRWFQLYWSSSDELVASLVGRAERSGCSAIVVTLDTHTLGWRPRDLDLAYLPFAHGRGIAQYTSDPVFQRMVAERAAAAGPAGKQRITPSSVATLIDLSRNHPGAFADNVRSMVPRVAVQTFLDVFSRPSLTWPDLAFLRERTRLPILLKGIQHPDDAARALDEGMDGVIVSNHGGRQVDGAIGSLHALPGIVDRIDGRAPVLFDSGVRSGADAFVALALGARAVLIGRPYVYGLAVAGADGAREVLRNLVAELDLMLGLSGYRSVGELGPEALVRI
ncbi:lactate 2-monooxygenase [Naasia lichenicola]|uniref:Lactate 2-monooxygenase n=1 Tax=Naasia lichenicola TaxID=2565933 RepID=A0A4S4FUN3_9MICO|nr:lactate 2-monooxygenase [Naasia lichenicola]THG33326.1 lactate 2-monooxygenase [Naasia lichenicola]